MADSVSVETHGQRWGAEVRLWEQTSRPVGGESMLGQGTKLLRLHNSETGFIVLSSPWLPLTPKESRRINHLLPFARIFGFFPSYTCSPVWMGSGAVGLECSRVDVVTQLRSDSVDPHRDKPVKSNLVSKGPDSWLGLLFQTTLEWRRPSHLYRQHTASLGCWWGLLSSLTLVGR